MAGGNKRVIKCGHDPKHIQRETLFKSFLAMKKTMMGGVRGSGVRDTGH